MLTQKVPKGWIFQEIEKSKQILYTKHHNIALSERCMYPKNKIWKPYGLKQRGYSQLKYQKALREVIIDVAKSNHI